MSDYAQITTFATKDALSTGNPAKVIKGTEVDPELAAISVAIATKYDSADIATNAEAAALSSDAKLITPAKLLYALTNGTTGLVPTSRTVTAGAGLTGGGALSGNISLALSSPVAVANGGTAATTAAGARTALGLVIGTDVLAPNGSAASLTSFPTLNQNTSGTAAGLSATLAVASGGTGATSASAARTSLGLVIGTDVLAPSGSGTSLTGVVKTANNLSDVTAATARSNLGVTATGADTTYNARASNLSDVASAASARSNLGVTATGADTTYSYRANNLSDVASAATARGNLGAAASATSVSVSGTGLSGGGDLSASRTITIDQTAMTTRNITGKSGVTKTLSTSAASGGSDGDIWYQY